MSKKTITIIVVVIILLTVGILAWTLVLSPKARLKREAKKSGGGGTPTPTPTPTPTTTPTGAFDAQIIADDIYKNMKGANLWWNTTANNAVREALEKVILGSADNFKAVWDAFGVKDGDNLSQWVEKESYLSESRQNRFTAKAKALKLI